MSRSTQTHKPPARRSVSLYCDGAGSSNGSRAHHGGWAAILVYVGPDGSEHEKMICGHSYPETNQTMELVSLIQGLKILNQPCAVEFFSDSRYVVDGVNDWLENWQRDGWKTAQGKPIKNRDLWEQLLSLKHVHEIHGNWLRGHVPKPRRQYKHEMNARCDEEAVRQAWQSYGERHGS